MFINANVSDSSVIRFFSPHRLFRIAGLSIENTIFLAGTWNIKRHININQDQKLHKYKTLFIDADFDFQE